MSELFSAKDRILLFKKQVDKTTPVASFADAMAIRLSEFGPLASRKQGPLAETDSSFQQAATKVQSFAPGFSFGTYGRPTELVLLNELLFGASAGGGTSPTDTATPDQDSPYFGVLDIAPYSDVCMRWDGCRIAAGTFAGSDAEGDTFLKLTGWQVMARTFKHGVAQPVAIPEAVDEDPFIHAEIAVSYDSVHPGTTKAFTLNVNRNSIRAQGDSGFAAFEIAHGLWQVDGTLSRYTADDAMRRTIDTGTPTGTDPTAIVDEQTLSILYDRDSPAASFLLASQGVSYENREEALDPSSGNPYVEVLTVRTQPQSDIEDNLTAVVEV